MPEVVIVDAVRTPVGRAFKGSLAGLRPDETTAFVIDQLLERNSGVDPTTVEEVICGCGLPQGLQANNIGRIAVLLSEHLTDATNGSTVSRYCASGLDAIRIAANNIASGQGDTYIAAGVEFVSRYNAAQEAGHPEDQNEKLQGKEPGQPDAYIAMGLTAENVADKYGITREEQDEYAQLSQERAVAAQEAGVFAREIVAVTLPDGTVVDTDDGPRADSTVERLASLKPAFREDGTVTAGNAQLRCNRDAHGGNGRQRARVHGRRADRCDQQGARPRWPDDRRHRRDRTERGLRSAGAADCPRGWLQHRQAQPARRRNRARPPIRDDRRADHDNAAERSRNARRPLWP